jgi:hypothetical protein
MFTLLQAVAVVAASLRYAIARRKITGSALALALLYEPQG